MLPGDSETLPQAFVLDFVAQLSRDLVVSFNHVSVRVLRYRLVLDAMPVKELRSLVRLER